MLQVLGIEMSLSNDHNLSNDNRHNKDSASSWLTMDAATATTSEHLTTKTTATLPPAHSDNNVIENLALVNAMDNLKDLVLLFDGEMYKKSLGQEFFCEAFEQVFDKSSMLLGNRRKSFKLSNGFCQRIMSNHNHNHKHKHHNSSRGGDFDDGGFVELSYKESLQEYLTLFHAGVRADIIEFKTTSSSCNKKTLIGMTMIEYAVQAILKNGQKHVFQATAMVNPSNGKLVLVERQHRRGQEKQAATTPANLAASMSPKSPLLKEEQVVSEQVSAACHPLVLAARAVCKFPSEWQLAQQHVPPLACGGSNMLLTDDLLPTNQVGTVIKLRLVAAAAVATTMKTTTSVTGSPNVNHSNKRLRLPLLRDRQTIMTGATAVAHHHHHQHGGDRIDIQQADDASSPYAGGVWLQELKQQQQRSSSSGAGAAGTGFLLRNKQDIPIALCLADRANRGRGRAAGNWASLHRPSLHSQHQQESRRRCRAFNIMGRNPMYEHDRPTTSQFYPWYRVEMNHHHDHPRRNSTSQHNSNVQTQSWCTIFMWNGSRYEPLMATTSPLLMSGSSTGPASETETDHDHDGQQEYSHSILFSSVLENGPAHCRSLEPKFSYGYLTRQKETSTTAPIHDAAAATPAVWDLTIAPGVDPALMICLSAVMKGELIC